jgi:hypothetical protein
MNLSKEAIRNPLCFTKSPEEPLYYPHPETKPEHFQPPDILEIITSFISGLKYGDELVIEVDAQQMSMS